MYISDKINTRMNKEVKFTGLDRVIEKAILVFIALGSLYPHINYEKLNSTSEIIFFGIFLFSSILYTVTRFLFGIKLVSKDNINLLKTGGFIIFIIFLPTFFIELLMFILTGNVSPSASPAPNGLAETLGYMVYLPAMTSTLLFPYLKLICMLEKPTGANIASEFIVVLTIILYIITKSRGILIVGYLLSYLPSSFLNMKARVISGGR